ncbi:hypothetical protein ACJ73_10180, partial [Blastomyces percursus]
VFLDVTSLVDYNIELLNHNDLSSSFFHLDKTNPTQGFAYNARTVSGPSYPPSGQIPYTSLDSSAPSTTSDPLSSNSKNNANDNLQLLQRLILGSHLASYIRHQLEECKSYTATVGISTSKLLAKLAGNVHKPRNQTTLLPPYSSTNGDDDDDDDDYVDHDDGDDNDNDEKNAQQRSNIIRFLDAHDISAIPGIGFKIAQRIRRHVLGREPSSGIYEQLSKTDYVTVKDVRLHPNMGPLMLNELLLLSASSSSGSGGRVGGGALPRDIGMKIWGLLHGIDPSPVAEARAVPTQISIEDSYGDGRLKGLEVVREELVALARSLLRRMVMDLTEEVEGEEDGVDSDGDGDRVQSELERTERSRNGKTTKRRWLAHPRTIRLSTRIRLPPLPDGMRDFSAGRVSRSCLFPTYIFPSLLNTTTTTTITPATTNSNRNHTHNESSDNDAKPAAATHEAMALPTIDPLAIRLVNETILPLFRRLHSEKSGAGKICVMNIAVTNMVM